MITPVRTTDGASGADASRVRIGSGHAPPRDVDRPSERELKFLVPEPRAAFVGAWLRSVCAADAAYPPARVVTVYFDTAGLDLLDEKVNSDYLKTKVRVRWYEKLDGSPAGETLFVEAKLRVGSTRQKLRRRAGVQASDVARWALMAAGWPTLLDPLRLDGIDLPHDLLPVMRLSYVRERLTDRVSGGRLTFDSRMRVEAVNPQRMRPGLTGPIPGAVAEYKGRAAELPVHLRPLVASGGRKTSFSKYLAGYLQVTQGRL